MPEITDELTPSQIVAELDKYIIGQKNAKRAVAVALRNRYRRRRLPDDLRDEVIPKNILMIGPTGVGKTEIARRLALLARAPFVKVEATKFTEVGYVGRDVDSMVRDLLQIAIRMVEQEKLAEVRVKAEERAIDRILDILQPLKTAKRKKQGSEESEERAQALRQYFEQIFKRDANPSSPRPNIPLPEIGSPPEEDAQDERVDNERIERVRMKLRKQIEDGLLDKQQIEVTIEESAPSSVQIFPMGQGMEDFGNDLQSMLGNVLPKKSKQRKVTIGEAKQMLADEEAQLLIDRDNVTREAITRTEQMGIIFIDEIDKIAKAGRSGGGPDVSREGVQRDILPIIEGSTVNTKHGSVRTDHILFIAAGAFHVSKPSDLIPELQGRLPIRVELENLTEDDLKRILTEPRNALTRQYAALLLTEGITVEFTEDSITELARVSAEVNRSSENIGARRLHTVMERLLEEVSFQAPEVEETYIKVDAEYVRKRLDSIVKDEDLSKYIL